MVVPFAKYLILANIFFASGLLLNFALPPLISQFIDKQLVLQPEGQTYANWKEAPVPIYQKFYFFNVTNVQAIEQFGHKPVLQEIGPFVYRTHFSKRDVETDASGNTIDFKHFKSWQFEPDLSIADERLQLVTLNAPLAITLTLIQSASNAIRLLVTFSLDGLSDGFFTKRTVKQLLFEGYPDLLTTFGPLLNAEMLSQGGHFGYMNARNTSLDGTYEINTGQDDLSKLNTINRFNGRTKLPYWHHHSHCNSLEGATTGEMFPPISVTNPSNHIKLFQPDFCRVWRLDYASEHEQSCGLRLKRFKATRDVFRNSTDFPENSCFFGNSKRHRHTSSTHHTPSTTSTSNQNRIVPHSEGRQSSASGGGHSQPSRTGRQAQNNRQNQATDSNRHHGPTTRVRHEWPAGVFSLAPCKFNAPIYMSMPHFLDADPYFAAQVDGLQPDAEKHEFYVDLEPRTGSPVTLSARVQLNVAISKPPGLVRFRNVPEIMFPVFWQELSVNLTGPVIDQLLLASRGAQETNIRVSYSLLLLGLAILIITCLFYLHSKFSPQEEEEVETK